MGRMGRNGNRVVEEGLVLAPLEDLPAEETKWLWPGRIARGSVTLLVGYPEVGKSFVALDIATRVSRGTAWPDGTANDGPGGVVLFSAEDHLVRKVRAALKNGEADFSRCHTPYRVFRNCGEKRTFRPINFKRDLQKLEDLLEQQADSKLLVVDPLNAGEKVPRVEWERKAVGISADAALARRKKRTGPAATQRREAIVYLRKALRGGRRLVKEVEAEARAEYCITPRTLERARKALRIKSFRIDGVGPYWMELPSLNENEIETRKKRGEPGGPEGNPGNHEGFVQESGPPVGGPETVSGGPVPTEGSR